MKMMMTIGLFVVAILQSVSSMPEPFPIAEPIALALPGPFANPGPLADPGPHKKYKRKYYRRPVRYYRPYYRYY